MATSWFWPGAVTVVVVMLLFHYMGSPDSYEIVLGGMPVLVPLYTIVFAVFILFLMGLSIRRIAGKPIRWWVMPVVALSAIALLRSPVLTALQSLTSSVDQPLSTDGFLTRLVRMFLLAGLPEELLKAIPVVVGVWLGVKITNPASPLWRFRVVEPLDGILFGAAAGLGFAFEETLFQYVPINSITQPAVINGLLLELQAAHVRLEIPRGINPIKLVLSLYQTLIEKTDAQHAAGAIRRILEHQGALGLDLMIPRLLGNICGHAAYAGIFGYFIGLAVLKPVNRLKTIGIGFLLAAGLHGAWDASGGEVLGAVVKLLVFAVFATAITKAREISPNRQNLMASQLVDRFSRLARSAPAQAAPAPVEVSTAGLLPLMTIEIGTACVPVAIGARLYEAQTSGARSRGGDKIIAEVSENPEKKGVLGLKNLSDQTWQITMQAGERRDLAPGRAIRLGPGLRMKIGDLDARVTSTSRQRDEA